MSSKQLDYRGPDPLFSEGDGITATCNDCKVSVTVPLPAGKTYDQRLVDQAADKATDWLRAHVQEFHPHA